MADKLWNITFEVFRKKGDQAPFFQSFALQVDPDEYVLDGVERIWAFHDRSLTYRHACHHSTCGACGMIVNGVEKLTCITPIRSVTKDGGTVRLEPIRNFPVLSDLVVDMSRFYQRMDAVNFDQVTPLKQSGLPYERNGREQLTGGYERLVDCIECGLCISACPIAITTEEYLGPAVLAAIQDMYHRSGDTTLFDLADQANGAWRCHSAFECSAVCPSNVDPGWRIMDLRKHLTAQRIRRLFGLKG